jgi:serine phosphatase RsbU (regulator of sigma subunit)
METLADSALGIPATKPYRQIERDLLAGSRLVMYTDGLVERRRTPVDEGIATLARVLREAGPLELEELADHIFDRLLGEDAHDDAALMIIELPATLA